MILRNISHYLSVVNMSPNNQYVYKFVAPHILKKWHAYMGHHTLLSNVNVCWQCASLISCGKKSPASSIIVRGIKYTIKVMFTVC